MTKTMDYAERRKRQRFVVKRGERSAFWVEMDGAAARIPLIDLSLEGFSIPASEPPATARTFSFVLRLDDTPDKIRGQARIVNFVPSVDGGQIGCRFETFEGDGASDLRDWLIVHVITSATVRISEKDAASIVAGPSLI
jgi:hypothetical protein